MSIQPAFINGGNPPPKEHASTTTTTNKHDNNPAVKLSFVIISVAQGIFISLGFILIGLKLMDNNWMKWDDTIQSYFLMQPMNLVGLFLVLSSCAVGPTALGVGMLALSRYRCGPKPFILPTVLAVILTAGTFIGAIVGGVLLCDVGEFFWWQGPVPMVNTLNILLGTLIISVYMVVAVASCFVTLEMSGFMPTRQAMSNTTEKSSYNRRDHIQETSRFFSVFNVTNLAMIFVSFILIFLLTLFLPHVWAITAPGPLQSWNQYFVLDSPYSLVRGVILFQRNDDRHMIYQNVTTTNTTNNATSTYIEYVQDPNWLQPIIYLKLYQTVVVYYSAVFGVVVIGTVGTYNQSFRRLLHKRIDLQLVDVFVPKWLNMWPLGISAGEVLLMCLLIGLLAYWMWYWYTWPYRALTDQWYATGSQRNLHVWANVMGEMATLTMSFLTFPMARNSVWETVFGVPFDRAIKYHRMLGALAWTFITLHMICYEAKWLNDKTLPINAYSNPNEWISVGTYDNPLSVRKSNWTIPLMEFTWLLCTLALSAAALRHVFHYELFVYTHWVMALFYLFSFIHAFQSWYYTAAGLLLYAFDKVIRTWNASRHITVVGLEYYKEAKITRVVLPADTFSASYSHLTNGGHHLAGQFVWINIPMIHPLEWHPFSLSSAPCQAQKQVGGSVELSVMDMGEDTWTHKLALLASEHAAGRGLAEGVREVSIAVDGPYGRSISYAEHDTVVLVGGGIGITPMISVYSELAERLKMIGGDTEHGDGGEGLTSATAAGLVQQVHMVWVMRTADVLVPFANQLLRPLLLASATASADTCIHVHLFITSKGEENSGRSAENVLAAAGGNLLSCAPRWQEKQSHFHDVIPPVAEQLGPMYPLRSAGAEESLNHPFAPIDVEASYSEHDVVSCGKPTPVLGRMSLLPSGLHISYGRPDWTALFTQIDHHHRCTARRRRSSNGETVNGWDGFADEGECEGEVEEEEKDGEQKTMGGIAKRFANLGRSSFSSFAGNEGQSVACMVCGPRRLADAVSAECFRRDWTFQAEEFVI